MATPNKPGMSTRLLQMKFMQRAAASSPTAGQSSADERPSKRQRHSEHTTDSSSEADLKAVRDAVAESERKRLQALERQAAEAGETKWTLSVTDNTNDFSEPALKVLSVGYSGIDSRAGDKNTVQAEDKTARIGGRKTFGNYNPNPEPEKSQMKQDEDESRSDKDSSSDSEGDNLHVRGFGKVDLKRKGTYDDEPQNAAQLAARRRNESKKATAMTSISSGGGPPPTSSGSRSEVQCYRCGKTGHMKYQCPQNRQPLGVSGPKR